MVDGIGRKSFDGGIGRGNVGKWTVGHKELTERERQETAKIKAMNWRDRARHKFLLARDRLKVTLHRNEKKSEAKESTRRKNINPLFAPLTPKFSRRGRPTFTHSLVPEKPKYSLAEPEERIYGKKWDKLPDSQKRISHPAIRKAIEEIRTSAEQKTKEIGTEQKTEEIMVK